MDLRGHCRDCYVMNEDDIQCVTRQKKRRGRSSASQRNKRTRQDKKAGQQDRTTR